MEILRPPKTLILKTSGINCDEETRYAFDIAGTRAEIVQINQLKDEKRKFSDFQIVVIPGGFSFRDDIASGRIMALELKTYLYDQIMEHKEKGRLILGICNGFQVLVQSGLLPFGKITSLKNIKASLEPNPSGHFESRWIFLKSEESICPVSSQMTNFTLPVAHGEGRFVAEEKIIDELEKNGQIILRYSTSEGDITMDYPANPNGSINSIAGICDPSGRIIGLMPHPERAIEKFQSNPPQGLEFIKNVVNLAKES